MFPPFLINALSRLRHPTPIYLVGGSVRDSLLGRPCHDWDFVCRDARAVAQRLRRRLRAKLITLDDQNRIYRLILPASRAGERLTVDFAELVGDSIQSDLRRRDFAINAMAIEVGKPNALIDPRGGMSDLRRGHVRAVSTGAFKDDPLRLIRAFRIATQLRFSIDSGTLRLIRREASCIRRTAPERIREELMRLLSQADAASALQTMDHAGLLGILFPSLEVCRKSAVRYYGRGGVLKHSLNTVANMDWMLNRLGTKEWPLLASVAPRIGAYAEESIGGFPRSAWLRLAGLLHDVGKPATAQVIKGRLRFFGHEDAGADIALGAARTLRCSRHECHLLAQWVRNHMRLGNLAAAPQATDKAIARFFRDLGDNAVGMLLVSLADHYDYLPRRQWGKSRDPVEKLTRRCLERYYTERQKLMPPKLVDGHILMRALKLKPGRLIGELLDAVRDAQAEGRVSTKKEAIAWARTVLARLAG